MDSFTYSAPTRILFGNGRIGELGAAARPFGKKALMVTGPCGSILAPLYERVKANLAEAGVGCVHFDSVIPNPTTDVVTRCAGMARDAGADMIIGIGGGSSLDVAKAAAVEATHPGTAWDYLHYKPGPTPKTLPVIAVGTTAGSGSQTTPCAVITNTAMKDKSAIWHENILPKIAIVDPDLTVTMPPSVTAETGFDAFCHNFEAFISVNSNDMVECMALDAIRRVIAYLPKAMEHGCDMEARAQMAWADTLGGLTNSSAGVTLPHGLGMQIGGHCPHVTHGQALAVVYPQFLAYTLPEAVGKFAAVARIFDPALHSKSDADAAGALPGEMEKFLRNIGLWTSFGELGVSMADIRDIADDGQVLGDYRNNPRVASIEEMYELLVAGFTR